MQPILNQRRIARFGALFGVMTMVTACSSALDGTKKDRAKSSSQALDDESGVIRISTSTSAWPSTGISSWPSTSTSTSPPTSTPGGGGGSDGDGDAGNEPSEDAGACGVQVYRGTDSRTVAFQPKDPFNMWLLCPAAKKAAADACTKSADALCWTAVQSDKFYEVGCGDVNTNPDGSQTRLCHCSWDVTCLGTYRAK